MARKVHNVIFWVASILFWMVNNRAGLLCKIKLAFILKICILYYVCVKLKV